MKFEIELESSKEDMVPSVSEVEFNFREREKITTDFIGMDGKLLDRKSGDTPSYRLKGGEMYVRAVVSYRGKKAWTQPVFVR